VASSGHSSISRGRIRAGHEQAKHATASHAAPLANGAGEGRKPLSCRWIFGFSRTGGFRPNGTRRCAQRARGCGPMSEKIYLPVPHALCEVAHTKIPSAALFSVPTSAPPSKLVGVPRSWHEVFELINFCGLVAGRFWLCFGGAFFFFGTSGHPCNLRSNHLRFGCGHVGLPT
jgi:hypothetical protein